MVARTKQTDQGSERPCPNTLTTKRAERVISKGTHGAPTPPFPTSTKTTIKF